MPDLKLAVPFYAQNDNEDWIESDGYGVPGNVQCAATSNAMLLAFALPSFVASSVAQGYREPESYYKRAFTDLGWTPADRGNHDAHTETLASLGLKTVWRTDLARKDISASLAKGFPVVVGLEYKSAGHICIIVGETPTGFLLHDPYGVRNGAENDYEYINPGEGGDEGSYEHYSFSLCEQLLFVGGGAWGRLSA